MNALTGIKHKRKKSENKPQTQINKCNNEKRRREQENIYIEELAELISANFADMSSLSVKPDKCAILQETVNQIRRIKQQDTNQQNADPVQQGEVSSSRPTILSNEIYGPLLLEALEGFLFVVNSEGKVEHVTENVSNYIKYTKDEIIGKSIYNFMHPGDHTKFHSNLLPMTIEWGSEQPAPTRSKSIDVRLLVKPPDDLDETVEEKRQRVTCYELMHISSAQLRDQLSVPEDDGRDGPCLLCVASRISHRDKASCSFEQFTTKLDTSGKIVCVDTSSVSEAVSQVLRKDFKGRLLRDLVPSQDVHKLTTHLKETLSVGTSISSVYRIQVTPDKFVQVQTKSKLFKTNPPVSSDSDFIMATHSIISDNETLGPEDPGGGIGGPLMTSVVNGAGPTSRIGPSSGGDPTPLSSASSVSMMSTAPTSAAFVPGYPMDDFSIDFPTTTWPDLEAGGGWPEATRPDSRQSVTPVSTPRPPSNPSYSNAPTVVQSPLAHYSAQQSPANQSQQSQNSNYNPFGLMDDYPEQNVFPVDDEKDTKANVLEEAASLADSHRLRILLTNPPTSSASTNSNSQQEEGRDRILKELLNQQDDDQGSRIDNRSSPRGLMNRGPLGVPHDPPKSSASSSAGSNNMLRQLLNEKCDDGSVETKTDMKKNTSELLQQLLKKDSNDGDDKNIIDNGSQEDTKRDLQQDSLLRSLGFPSDQLNGERRGSKRSSDEMDDRESKTGSDGAQVSSSGLSSELCKKNKMLASLLAKQSPNVPSIPPIPASVISALPQEKLPRVTNDPAKLIGGTMAQNNVRQNNNTRLLGRQQLNYLNSLQRHGNPVSGLYANQATSTSDNNNWGENNNFQGMDPILSDLLDHVIDLVPDNDILPILDAGGAASETAAINIIQKSLMLCENAVKSPTSPNISLPARPPAYSANVTSQNNLGYPPPPNYPQAKYQRQLGVRAGAGPQYATANLTSQQQLILLQQRKVQQQQAQEQKQRLLQQQKQQQLLIPSNATSAEINSIQNIDSLLNNTVAPNVSLQRSNSVPESQLSPNYSNQLQGSSSLSQTNQRGVAQQPGQQQPYSPHSQMPSPLGQQSFQTQTSANSYNQRLSPQSQFNAQLSPRQAYPQGNGSGGGNWAPQRITVQQNPMLSSQLTGSLTGRGNFQRPPAQQPQQQRTLNSPGVSGARHSPFAGDQFAPPSSPNAAFNQTQYLQRLQRANSVPTTTTQMTGGLGSPRPYPGNQAPPHYPPNPLQPIPPAPMLYSQQQDSPYNCYDQQQPGLVGYERRASGPPHLPPGVAGSNPTSEFVRQELRAVVGARTAQAQPAGGQRPTQTQAQQMQQMGQQQTVDLESLGINFEMASGASESPKLWGAMGSEMGSMSPQPATSRTTMEEGRPGDHTKTSLLQQLLSDQK